MMLDSTLLHFRLALFAFGFFASFVATGAALDWREAGTAKAAVRSDVVVTPPNWPI